MIDIATQMWLSSVALGALIGLALGFPLGWMFKKEDNDAKHGRGQWSESNTPYG